MGMSKGMKIAGAALTGAALAITGIVVSHNRSHRQTDASAPAEVASQSGFPAGSVAPSDPSVIGSWHNVRQFTGRTISVNFNLGADGRFEQVLDIPPGRIIYTGRYRIAGGQMTFAQDACRVEGQAPFPNPCEVSVNPASYVIDKDALTIVSHRPTGDDPPLRLERLPAP
jgi:hypothetical protein